MQSFHNKTFHYLGLFFISIISTAGHIQGCPAGGDTFQFDHDAQGNLVGVWEDNNEGPVAVIKGSTLRAGGTWENIVPISSPKSPSVKPVIEVAENGNAVALWFSSDIETGSSVLVSSTIRFGECWSDPVIISDPKTEQVMNNAYGVSIDSNGHMIALWTSLIDTEGNNVLIKAMRSSSANFGENWSPPLTIDPV